MFPCIKEGVVISVYTDIMYYESKSESAFIKDFGEGQFSRYDKNGS